MPQRLNIEKVNEALRLHLEKDDDGKFLTQQAVAKRMNASLRQVQRYLDPIWRAERLSILSDEQESQVLDTFDEGTEAQCEAPPPSSVADLQKAGLPPEEALQMFGTWRFDHGRLGGGVGHRRCHQYGIFLMLLNDNVPISIADTFVKISLTLNSLPPGLFPGDEIVKLYQAYRPWESDKHRGYYKGALLFIVSAPLKFYFQALQKFYRSIAETGLHFLGNRAYSAYLPFIELPKTLFFLSEYEVSSSPLFDETLLLFNRCYPNNEEREEQ